MLRKRKPGGGRKPTSPELTRIKLTDFRLPRWLVDWIKGQPRSGGEVVKEAVVSYYHLDEPNQGMQPTPGKGVDNSDPSGGAADA